MRKFFSDTYIHWFFRDRIILASSVLALGAHVILWTMTVLGLEVLFNPEREFITLHYKLFYGPDLYTEWYYVFVIPLSGLAILVVNFFLARIAYPSLRMLAYAIHGTTLACQAFLLIAAYLIIQINIF